MAAWRAFVLVLALLAPPAAANDRADLVRWGMELFDASEPAVQRSALSYFAKRGEIDAAPLLILAMRFLDTSDGELVGVLQQLTGESTADDWNAWMLWQQAHPEIRPFDGFQTIHARVHAQIDGNFRLFLQDDTTHEIRVEEITWGGVKKDGIPALTLPRLIAADAAHYLEDEEQVFGLSINGDARAYPLRLMDWHEMFNDVVGGVPVSLAYCTLCGSGILFETAVEGFPYPLVFGSSGFLYRSNKLMYDTYTHSLWNQFTGRPVAGPLTGSGIELRVRPVAITTWGDWRRSHRDTRVLAIDTGYARDYRPGRPYGTYFSSPEMMFPALVDESRLKAKDQVFALRGADVQKAWPLALFAGGAVINDSAGALDLVLIGDAASRTVRAYRADGLEFAKSDSADRVRQAGTEWQVTETALVGPEDRRLARLPGHIAYWFAWSGYFGGQGELGGGR
ncbi:MAG: DUF3179 domain-containing protein [Alphaproteobacteria bacterium]